MFGNKNFQYEKVADSTDVGLVIGLQNFNFGLFDGNVFLVGLQQVVALQRTVEQLGH
ncbi:MAG: hypothetical protein U5K79_03650 [Cyclobacteriaceae bacterium]|nr:hypothetical protein [Cyclobacteriaceae bacterium]